MSEYLIANGVEHKMSGGKAHSTDSNMLGATREDPSSFRVEPNNQNRWSSLRPVGMWAGCL